MATSGQSPVQNPSFAAQFRIAEAVRLAAGEGRQIVPVVGAGLSADSGFPVVRSIVRYLAKIHTSLGPNSPLPNPCDSSPSELMRLVVAAVRHRYFKEPRYYVHDFGWPDRFRMNQDLVLLNADAKVSRNVTQQVVTELDTLAASIHVNNDWKLLNLFGVTNWKTTGDDPKEFQNYAAKSGSSARYDVYGDWRRLIQHFTGYDTDFADTLLDAMGRGKVPNLGHRMLTFLARYLSVRNIFTFNFDSLIERALEFDGYTPKVFGMEEGRGLPHGALADESISLIKMHGSTHGLLLDERLDRPLSVDYLRRFDHLVGENPFLLVIGCSGGDFRLESLVKHVLKKRTGSNFAVAWLHFEDYKPSCMKQEHLPNDVDVEGGICGQTTNLAGTLSYLYAHMSSRMPASRVPYAGTVERAARYAGDASSALEKKDINEIFDHAEKIVLVSTIDPSNIDDTKGDTDYPQVTASEALYDIASTGSSRGYTTVTVNLEAVHSLAGVVGAIVDQCRRYDTTLVPSVLASEELPNDTRNINKAVAVVAHALQRSRYLVLLDGLEAYLWSVTTHHGETTLDHTGRDRFDVLCKFFTALNATDVNLAESRVVIALEHRQLRNSDYRPTAELRVLADHTLGRLKCLNPKGKNIPYTRYFRDDEPIYALLEFNRDANRDKYHLSLLMLSACRRMRGLAMIRHILRPLFGGSKNIDPDFLNRLVDQHELGFLRMEGSVLWISRPVRNAIYGHATKACNTAACGQIFGDGVKPEEQNIVPALVQLFVLYGVHYRLTRTYFVYNFDQSHDANAFLEYTYHRISCVRYVVKLIAILRLCSRKVNGGMEFVHKAFQQLNQLFNNASPQMPKDDPTRYSDNLKIRLRFRKGEALHHALASKDPITVQIIDDVISLLEKHFRTDMTALNRAWQRHEPLLRQLLPAQHLLQWCEQLLGDDLKYRCHQAIWGYEGGVQAEPVFKADCSEIADFSATLKTLRVKLLSERGDHERVMTLRADDLGVTVTRNDWTSAVRELGGRPDPLAGEDVHHALDILNAMIRLRHTSLSAARSNVYDPEAELLKVIETALARHDTNEASVLEAVLRMRYLKVERELPGISVFSSKTALTALQCGKNATNFQSLLDEMANAEDLNCCQIAADIRAPRSVIIDRTPDGSLYRPYRTAFLLLRARLTWMKELHELHSTPKSVLDINFKTSFRYFEQARAGRAENNQLLSVLVEIYMAEACLVIGRLNIEDQTAERTATISRARAYHETARGSLQRALGHLHKARRNGVWWSLYFTFVSQYHMERLRVIDAQSEADKINTNEPEEQKVRKRRKALSALGRIRRAMNAVANAARFQSRPPEPDSWLERVWADVLLLGRTILDNRLKSTMIDYLANEWKDEKRPQMDYQVDDVAKACTDYILKQLCMLEKLTGQDAAVGMALKYTNRN